MLPDQSTRMMIDSQAQLVAIESADPWQLIARFRKTACATGQSIYVWRKRRCLARLGIGHIEIPNTSTTEAALRYIARSKHYGIYLLQDITGELKDQRLADILFEISRTNSQHQRKVILLEKQLQLPDTIRPLFQQLRHQPRTAQGNG